MSQPAARRGFGEPAAPPVEAAPDSHGGWAQGIRLDLQRRAPGNLRRHLTRHLIRTAVLLITDLASFALLRALYRFATRPDVLSRRLGTIVSTVLPAGRLEGWEFAVALILGLAVTGNYGSGDMRREPGRLLAGCALAVALPLWAPMWAHGVGPAAAQFVFLTLAVWMMLVVTRLSLEAVDAHVVGRQPESSRTVLVGPAEECRELGRRAVFADRSEHALLGFVDTGSPPVAGSLGSLAELPGLLHRHRVETLVICGTAVDRTLRTVVEHGITSGCHVFAVPRVLETPGVQPRLVWKRGQPLVELNAQTLRAQQFAIKRLLDVFGAVMGLIVLSPALAALAALIKLESKGPAIFSHLRAGIGGRPFRMRKFRTMHDGADGLKESLVHLNRSGDVRLFKITEDPRVTRLGRWLRRWSLDELPQLWNVLKGEMSLVGPRPFPQTDLDYYEIHHFGRLGAKPGITGLWQVNGRSDILDFEEVVALDTRYVREWSLLLDLAILARTIPAVVRRRGAL